MQEQRLGDCPRSLRLYRSELRLPLVASLSLKIGGIVSPSGPSGGGVENAICSTIHKITGNYRWAMGNRTINRKYQY